MIMSNGARSFTITPSAKAFQILSDKLYKNKQRAVLRELSTNAVDSHKMANQTRPFEVHIPDYNEPWLSVRDYGTGMSREKIETLYTGYFESDKTESEEQNGFLGLGSKSPFSLVQTFNVTSIYDGIKTIYTTYINEDGVPQLIKIFEEGTSEPVGIEVRLDFQNPPSEFMRELDVFTYFGEYMPIVSSSNGQIDMSRYTVDFKFSGPGWAISESVGHGWNKATAMMAMVAYPISREFFSSEDHKVDFIVSNYFVLYFNNRELDFAPSREELNYNSQTINAIVKKCHEVYDSFFEDVQKNIDKLESYWESKKYVHILRSKLGNFEYDFTYSGRSVGNQKLSIDNLLDYYSRDEIDDIYSIIVGGRYSQNKNKIWPLAAGYYNKEHDEDKRKVKILYRFGELDVNNTYTFVIDDIGKKLVARRRAKHYASMLKDQGAANFAVVLPKMSRKFLEAIGGFTALKASKLEDPPRVSYAGNRSDFCVLDNRNRWTDNKEEIDLSDESFYTIIKRYESYLDKDHKVGNHFLHNVISMAKSLKIIPEDMKIYGVKYSASQKKSFNQGNWNEIYSYISNKLEELIDQHREAIEASHFSNEIKAVVDRQLPNRMSAFMEKYSNHLEGTKFSKMYEEYQKLTKPIDSSVNVFVITQLASCLKVEIKTSAEFDEEKIRDKFDVYKTYPMLRFVFASYRYDDNIEDTLAYIKMIG